MRYLVHCLSIALFLAAAGCNEQPSTGARIDSRLRPFVPPDTAALAGIDVSKIVAAPLYQKHQDLLNLPLLNASSEKMGLDPRRDLSAVLVAWSKGQSVSIATGRFSSKNLEPRLVSLGAQKSTHGKNTVLTFEQGSLFFPRKDVLIAGSTPVLDSMIDAKTGSVSEGIQSRLKLLSAADQAWVVSSEGLSLGNFNLSPNIQSALSNLVRFVTASSLGINIDTGAHLESNLKCISPDGAKQVHDALRGVIGFARLSTRDDQLDLLRVYDAIHVDQDNDSVRIRADLDSQAADKLLSNFRRPAP